MFVKPDSLLCPSLDEGWGLSLLTSSRSDLTLCPEVTRKVADKKPGKAPPRNTYWKLPGVPED